MATRTVSHPATRVRVTAAAVLVLTACTEEIDTSGDPPPPSPAGRVVEIDVVSGAIIRDLAVGSDPLLAVAASGSIWTLDLADGSLWRIDTASGDVRAVDVGTAVGLASDGTDVWVAADQRFLKEVDGTTGAIERSLALADTALFELRNAGFLAIDGERAWITVPAAGGGPQSLWRLDLDTGVVAAEIEIGVEPAPLVFGGGAVWIAHRDDSILRVDAETDEVTTLDLGPFPWTFAIADDRLWASTAGTIHELDPSSGRERRRFDVRGAARGLAWAGDLLWVATSTSVVAVEPEGGRIEHQIELAPPSDDEGPIALVPADGSLWVTIETQ